MTLLSETKDLYKKFQEEHGIYDDRIQRAIGPVVENTYDLIRNAASSGKKSFDFKLMACDMAILNLHYQDVRLVAERIHNILRKREGLTVYVIDNKDHFLLSISGWA